MSGFSTEWLTLRESHDLRARNRAVLDAVAAAFASLDDVTVVDLACGTGSTVRALSPHLPPRQHWHLVDNDPRLLAVASEHSSFGNVELTTVEVDLANNIELPLDRTTTLVTTSALLDLVSDTWVNQLAEQTAARMLPVYAALTYVGRVELSPCDPLDEAVITALNVHQRTDKGFGPALGPSAAQAAIAAFEKLNYSIVQGASDWIVGPDSGEMQAELLAGFATAAREIDALSRDDIGRWLARRTRAIQDGRSKIRVGHMDFFATPSAMR